MIVRRLMLFVLCASFALGVPSIGAYAGEVPAEPPCASAGESPCDCGEPDASGCALACAIAFSSAAPLPAQVRRPAVASADAVSGGPPARFASIAGPPGLQPPR